ncbi:hypothetical protein J7E88_12130 [Streptomyces sp. ISL-10]|uniref:hypothetical protein n=1 Tax=Streptomyces sp. ISL-10 TaxID=2819172 RepID=UPI001BE9A6B2|nr:hypothetical protein [Streptomyces sp. ISL-10]MBT2366036.1 hypothetical protein [Streptomyces sp. ISL-10]
MGKLNWRTANLTQNENLVPDPRAEQSVLRNIPNASVAVKGGSRVPPHRPQRASPRTSDRRKHR